MRVFDRRVFFKYMALLGVVLFGATALHAKAPKDKVKYQDQPKDSKKCSSCTHFVAETKECRLVNGTVAPEGWCTLYVKNPKQS